MSTSSAQTGPPKPVALYHVQSAFEYLQGQRLCSLQCLANLTVKKKKDTSDLKEQCLESFACMGDLSPNTSIHLPTRKRSFIPGTPGRVGSPLFSRVPQCMRRETTYPFAALPLNYCSPRNHWPHTTVLLPSLLGKKLPCGKKNHIASPALPVSHLG